MKKISCGISGTDEMPVTHRFSDLPCDPKLAKAIQQFYGDDFPLRPAQEEAVFGARLLESTKNAILTTPTNSGKSLISYLLLFAHAAKGHRVVLLEPLRALAQEKWLELTQIAEAYKDEGGDKVRVVVTTGDYRTSDDFLNTKPQSYSGGQIIVATPERLDAISRDRTNEGWVKKISFVCVDEAHMIGDRKRGVALELLISYLRSLEDPPRIVLMSATIANAEELATWLSPCGVINSVERYPKLEKYVYAVEPEDDINSLLLDEVETVIKEEGTSVLAFVGSKAAAEKAASEMIARFGVKMPKKKNLLVAEAVGVAWYHAGLSAATKQQVYGMVKTGKVRVVFATTALGMGVNLPATHVFVRDLKIGGGNDMKNLDTADILQMLGRAGRGNRSGVGVVFAKVGHEAQDYAKRLKEEKLPWIVSRLSPPEEPEGWYGRRREDEEYEDAVSEQLLGLLYRRGAMTVEAIEDVLGKSLGGAELPDVRGKLETLADPERWAMVWQDENTQEYHLRTLGERTAASYLPVRTAAQIGSFIRCLLFLDIEQMQLTGGRHELGGYLTKFTELDWLIMACVAAKELKSPISWKKGLPLMLNREMENIGSKRGMHSLLYNEWGKSQAELLYDSIVFAEADMKHNDRRMVVAMLTAVLIYRLSEGDDLAEINQLYGIDVAEIQEKLRDGVIWILAGIRNLLDSKCFYHKARTCLEETFGPDAPMQTYLKSFNLAFSGRKGGTDPVTGKKVDRVYAPSHDIFASINGLKFRTNLGKMIIGIKAMFPAAKRHPGEGTIVKLEKAGILAIKDLVGKKESDLEALGVEKDYAQMIVAYIRNRLK